MLSKGLSPFSIICAPLLEEKGKGEVIKEINYGFL